MKDPKGYHLTESERIGYFSQNQVGALKTPAPDTGSAETPPGDEASARCWNRFSAMWRLTTAPSRST